MFVEIGAQPRQLAVEGEMAGRRQAIEIKDPVQVIDLVLQDAGEEPLGLALDRILAGEKTFILDFSAAAFVDTSGAQAIRSFIVKARRQNVEVFITAAAPAIRNELERAGVSEPQVRFAESIEQAAQSVTA